MNIFEAAHITSRPRPVELRISVALDQNNAPWATITSKYYTDEPRSITLRIGDVFALIDLLRRAHTTSENVRRERLRDAAKARAESTNIPPNAGESSTES